MSAPRLVLALTDPRSALLVRGQITFLARRGFDVHLVTGPGEPAATLAALEGATHHPVDLARDIAPVHDVRALAALVGLLRRLRPDLVDGSTPKAGLLAMIAAAAVRVPVRVHTLRGLRVETARGGRRGVLWAGHRIACDLAHKVICVGPSLRARAIELGVVSADKAIVLGPGSGNGVDVEAFAPGPLADAAGQQLRTELGIPALAPVVAFVGRLARDKGLAELVAAWPTIRAGSGAHLVVAGGDDPTDPIEPSARAALTRGPAIHLLGERRDVLPVYAAASVLVLPSRREGFANVLLEAAAMRVPAVASDIPGCQDVVVDGVTGTLAPPGDAAALAAAVGAYLAAPELARAHGRAARERVVKHFRNEDVWGRIADAYQRLLAAR